MQAEKSEAGSFSQRSAARIVWSAPGRPRFGSFFPPPDHEGSGAPEGAWGPGPPVAEDQPPPGNARRQVCAVCASFACCEAFPLRIDGPERRLPALRAASSLRRRAALSLRLGASDSRPMIASTSASSWQGTVVSPGGAPTPPGGELAKLVRGRRIGRRPGIARCRPPGRTPHLRRLTPVRPAITTPHDSAPQADGTAHGGLIPSVRQGLFSAGGGRPGRRLHCCAGFLARNGWRSVSTECRLPASAGR